MPQEQSAPNRILTVVLAMVVLVPLLAFPTNQAMQNLANKAIQIMAALLAGLLVLRGRFSLRRASLLSFLGTGANLAVLLYLGSAILSLSLIFPDPALRRLGLMKFQGLLAGALLYFTLSTHVLRSRHLLKLADALVQVAGLMSILGLAFLAVQTGSYRATVFGDGQLFGAFLMILLPIPLVFAVSETDSKRKITAQVCAVLDFIGLITSGTRSAWIGALTVVAALGVFSLIGRSNRGKQRTSRSQILIPVLTVLACCVFAALQGDAMRLINLRLVAGGETLMLRQRTGWYAAEQLTLHSPAVGTGLGTFAVYQYPYTGFGRPGTAVLKERPSLAEMAHSLWLETAAEQGLIGAALLGAVVLTFLAAGIRRLRTLEGGIRRSLLLASMAGIVGFAVDGISNPGWEFAQISMYFWLMLGIGTACMRPRPESRA
jgi:O-antigen ligase